MTELKINHDDDIIRTEEGGLILNPYNPLNVKITLDEVQCILSKYDVNLPIRNLVLYQRAFVHKSYTKRPNFENNAQNIKLVEKPPDCLPLSTKSNERLEFLGDGVLELVVKDYLMTRFPKENEGFMTEKKIALVKNEAIGKIAYDMGLHKWFILSKHTEEKKIRTNLKKLGCLFEAFIGALYCDFKQVKITDEYGNEYSIENTISKKFIEKIFETHVKWDELLQNNDNYKNILQVKIQKEFKVTPHYIEIENDDNGYLMGVYLCLGQDIYHLKHENSISISLFKTYDSIYEFVRIHGKILMFMGHGKNKLKKKAEQLACQDAIYFLSFIK
jgi:dsRNA-specific ribonuclease